MVSVEDSSISYNTGYVDLWNAKFQVHKKDYQRRKLSTATIKKSMNDLKLERHKSAVLAANWFFIDTSCEAGTFNWFCEVFNLPKERVLDTIDPNWRELYGERPIIGDIK